MRTMLRSKVRLLFMTCAVVLAIPAVALADTTIADGDGVLPAGDNNMDITGTVPCNSPTIKTAPVVVNRNGAAGSTNVFANSSTVTVSVLSTSGDLTATIPSGSNTITLPSDWGSKPNNTQSASVTSTVTVTPTVSGAGSGSVTYRATGQNSSGATINRDDTMNVSWTAGSCDSTGPVISPNIAGTLGDNGWYTSDVTLTWSVTDPESTVTSTTGCGTTTITADQNATTYTCSATSAGGTSSQSVSIKRDATPPTIDGSASPAPNANGWNNEDVTVSYLCDVNLSGVASCGPDETLSSNGADQSSTGIAVDNAGNSATDTVSNIDIDKALPSVTVNGFNNGAVFTTSDTLPTVSCTVSYGLSGPVNASPTPSVDDDRVNGVGNVTYTCDGADNADNTNSASKTLRVIHNFAGFFAPVDNPSTGKMNSLKAGSAVPLKFSLDGAPVAGSNTGQGLNVLTSQGSGQLVSATKISCSTGELLDPVPTTELVSASSTNLTYDGVADHYNLVWKTDKAWAGQCRQAVIVTNDGEPHKANFYFTK
jgi:hypothetical protein